jgi:hypothetical protein
LKKINQFRFYPNSFQPGLDGHKESKLIKITNRDVPKLLSGIKESYNIINKFNQQKEADETIIFPDQVLYKKTISKSNLDRVIPYEIFLQVSTYENNIYCFLKRFFFKRNNFEDLDKSDYKIVYPKPIPGDNGSWQPCKFPFQFCIENDKEDRLKDCFKYTVLKNIESQSESN